MMPARTSVAPESSARPATAALRALIVPSPFSRRRFRDTGNSTPSVKRRKTDDVAPAGPSCRSFPVHLAHEGRRLGTKALVRHAPAAGHVVVGELPGLELHLLRKALVPVRALVRRRHEFFDHGTPLPFKLFEDERNVF